MFYLYVSVEEMDDVGGKQILFLLTISFILFGFSVFSVSTIPNKRFLLVTITKRKHVGISVGVKHINNKTYFEDSGIPVCFAAYRF